MITSWKKMDLNTFQKVYKITSSSEDEDTKVLKAAAVLNGMEYDDILNMPLNETAELIKGTAFLYTKPEHKRLKKHYKINGTKYVPLKDLNDMTVAQYIDYQMIVSNSTEMLPQFMSIFLIPKGHKYNEGYSNEQSIKDLGSGLNVEEALSLASFFVNKCSRLMKHTLLYLEAQMEVEKMKAKDPQIKMLLKAQIKNIQSQRRCLDMYGSTL